MNIVKTAIGTLAAALVLASAPASAGENSDVAARIDGPREFVRASRVMGREVTDMSGNVLGEIDDYAIHESGRAFAVIEIGDFLGLGGSRVLVSHEAIALSPTTPDLLVYLGNPDSLAHAPRYEASLDALRATARAREAMVELREEREDVAEATRRLVDARARLMKERDDMLAAQAEVRAVRARNAAQ